MKPTKRQLEKRVDDLWQETSKGVGLIITLPECSATDDRETTEIYEIDRSLCEIPDPEIDGQTKIAIPHYKPSDWSGVVTVTEPEVVNLWATMPDKILQQERALREEHNDPIPEILTPPLHSSF